MMKIHLFSLLFDSVILFENAKSSASLVLKVIMPLSRRKRSIKLMSVFRFPRCADE